MARPTKAIVDYFPHTTNHGKELFIIENKYGKDGYYFYFKLKELLGQSENHYVNYKDGCSWEYLLSFTRTDDELAVKIMETLVTLGELDEEAFKKGYLWWQSFVDDLSEAYKRRTIELPKREHLPCFCRQKHPPDEDNVGINPQSKVKEIKEEDIKHYFWSRCIMSYREITPILSSFPQ